MFVFLITQVSGLLLAAPSYLAGDMLCRSAIGAMSNLLRLVVALASLLTVPLALWAGGLAQLSVLVLLAVLIFGVGLERRTAPPRRRGRPARRAPVPPRPPGT